MADEVKLTGVAITDDDYINAGDHIAVEKSFRGADIQHHGIVVEGRNTWKVIHFTPDDWTRESDDSGPGFWSRWFGPVGRLIDLSMDRNVKGSVIKSDLSTFTSGNDYLKVDYPEGTKTRHVESTIHMAESYLSEAGTLDFGAYNFLNNNCEHFATFCKAGIRVSNQTKLRVLIKSAAKSLVSEEKWKG